MSFNTGANLYVASFGMRPENVEIPTYQTRNPANTDINWPIGKRWINTSAGSEYSLTSLSSSTGTILATWTLLGGSSSDVNTLSGDSGSAAPVAGNIQIKGTANQITTTGSSGQVLLAIPPTFTSSGSITATLGNITATNGNIIRGTAGNKDVYTSVASTTSAGANSAGTVTLVAGTATISTTSVTASSIIRLYRQGIGSTGAAALGILTLGTVTAGTSFVINSVQAADATALQTTDVSVIGWEIVN